MNNNNNGRKDKGKAGRGRSRILFIKQFIENIEKTSYKELKVAVVDREEWSSIEIIESI